MGRRAGRHRRAGKREPNGRTQRKKQDLKITTARQQPHRKGLISSLRTDERAESPLGRLYLHHQLQRDRDSKSFDASRMLDGDCFDAGARYALVVGNYRSTIETPRATAGSGRSRSDCIAEACQRAVGAEVFDPEKCRCYRARARYDDAFVALHDAGRAALMTVNRVVIQGVDPAPEEIVYLVAGLRALAREFGLTRGRKGRNVINAN